MSLMVVSVARAIDEELGNRGEWDRLVPSEAARTHRDHAKAIARAALSALEQFDWPELVIAGEGPDGEVGVTLPSSTVQAFIRRTIRAALASSDPAAE